MFDNIPETVTLLAGLTGSFVVGTPLGGLIGCPHPSAAAREHRLLGDHRVTVADP